MLLNAKKQTEIIFKGGSTSLIFLYIVFGGMSLFDTHLISIYSNAFLLSFLIFLLIYLYRVKKKSEDYKYWNGLQIIFVFFIFLICVFFNYSSYWFKYSPIFSIVLFALQLVLFIFSYWVGYTRIAFELQNIELRKGIKLLHRTDPNLEKGVIYLKKQPGKMFIYKTRFNSLVLEVLFRIIKYGYIAMLGLGLLVGSGSSLIIVRIIENYLPSESDISPHHIAMYGFSLVVIPILAYYLPAIVSAIRWWKSLEAEVQERYGKVVYVWPDEQDLSKEENKL